MIAAKKMMRESYFIICREIKKMIGKNVVKQKKEWLRLKEAKKIQIGFVINNKKNVSEVSEEG